MELEEQGAGSGRVVLTTVRGRPTADCGDGRARVQRRTLAVLVATQVLGGAGMSAAVAVGG